MSNNKKCAFLQNENSCNLENCEVELPENCAMCHDENFMHKNMVLDPKGTKFEEMFK